jgi:hypothetical protein
MNRRSSSSKPKASSFIPALTPESISRHIVFKDVQCHLCYHGRKSARPLTIGTGSAGSYYAGIPDPAGQLLAGETVRLPD